MTKRSHEKLLNLFKTHQVVIFEQMQVALDNASRATTFRYLKQIPYQRSYNYNGGYYTFDDASRYDRFGLFTHHDIFFSRDATLTDTIVRLVSESEAGWTQRELQDVLKVRVQVVLLGIFRQGQVAREKLDGLYVYLHADSAVQAAQLTRRREQIEAAESAKKSGQHRGTDQQVILILLTLLRHRGANAADVVRYLRGHSPPMTMTIVRDVFARYELDAIGEKGGT